MSAHVRTTAGATAGPRREDAGGGARVLDGLDPQQLAAASHVRGPALVVAGAGSGKTTVLTRRIGHLIESGVAPSSIVLTTFTRPTAREMVARARAVCPAAEGIVAGNFHSLAHRLVREHHAVFGLPRNFGILDPDDVAVSVRRILATMEGDGPVQPKAVAKLISFAANTQAPLADVVALNAPKYLGFVDDVLEVARLYAEFKAERHMLDFDDLLSCFAAFVENPDSGAYIRHQWRHLMVDEHQDSNALQNRIVFGLAGDCDGDRSVMAVGDPSQSIYTFRGALPAGMFAFHRHWPGTALLRIETNYRSTPEIVACADAVDRGQSERFERRLRAGKPSVGRRPSLVSVQDREAEGAAVAAMVLSRRSEGVPYSGQAVLVRSMRNARNVEVALSARNIPYRVVGGLRIHEAAHVRDVLAVLRLMVNTRDEPAWMRFLVLFPKVGEKSAAAASGVLPRDCDFGTAVTALSAHAGRKPAFGPAVEVLAGVLGERSPARAMMSALSAMEPHLRATYDEWDRRRKDIETLVDIAAGFDTIEEFIGTVTVDVALDKANQGAAPDEDGVLTVSTVHGAKGLEWDTVYIPSFVEGHFPSTQAVLSGDVEEDIRILYVAVTRAKRELVILRPLTVMVRGFDTTSVTSPFQAFLRPHVDAVGGIRPDRERLPPPRPGLLVDFR